MKFIKVVLVSVLALFLLGFSVAYILFRVTNTERHVLDDMARKNVVGSFVELTDGITHYELSGPDTGKVVVLVHGFSVPYYIWDSTAVRLASEGYRVLRYDEFGRGFSDRPIKVYEASLLRQQLADLLSALHISSVHAMAGLSFGGPVVTDFVIHHPGLVNKVILVDPLFPDVGPAKLPYPESIARFMMAISPEATVAGQLTDLKYPAQFSHWADQYKVQMQYEGFRHALVSTRYHYAAPDKIRANYQELNALDKSVLLIWGKEDITTPFANSDSLLKVLDAEFVPVEDAAHLPHMEKAGSVNKRILDFLRAK